MAAITIEEAKAEARASVERSGTSFAAGMRILSRERREGMHAIYAFCREVDDIADGDQSVVDKRLSLAAWRAEIDRLYAGAPQTPVGIALLGPVKRYGLNRAEFMLMIEGMEMDAEGPIVAPPMETLFAYTRRVAGAVGMLSMPIFGAPKGEASRDFALALGDALQLTNILRDVGEDAQLGRLYLPRELLEKHGAPMSASGILDILPAVPTSVRPGESRDRDLPGTGSNAVLGPGFRRDEREENAKNRQGLAALGLVARDLAEVPKQRFAAARAALRALDWRVVRPALLMMGVYETYLRRLEARGWERIGAAVSLSKFEKAAIAARWYVAPKLASPA